MDGVLTSTIYTEESRAAVQAQLERLLADAHFSHSRRFPSFLRYVVDQTLAGNGDSLKERTLGVEIFGKDASYDTSNDPIVRVTAAEIRKRIAQYYQDPGHEGELKLSLPAGSYVPHFQFVTAEAVVEDAAAAPPLFRPTVDVPPAPPKKRRWTLLAGVAALLLVAAAAFVVSKRSPETAFSEFWKPILSSKDPVLFCVADQTQYTAISLRDAGDPAHQVTLKDEVTAVVIDDLSAITKIAGVMQSAGKRYTLRGESKTSLMDLRNGPSVMIGAFDNAWTLRLLHGLRFHFANNAQMTTFSIVDTAGKRSWVVDRTQQMATNNYRDYAIVARFTDNTTGKPTLIAAGIGRGGTVAAGEFLTSTELLEAVRRQRPSAAMENVEVVLSTQIIDGEPGTPTIEAVYFW